jgi:hypothetical protein
MRYILTFFLCAIVAVAGVVIYLSATLPHGEGAFGVAKVVPLILPLFCAIAFSVIWFPANLAVFLWHRRTHPSRPPSGESKSLVGLSACLFGLCIVFGAMWLFPSIRYQPPPPPPPRPIEIKDIKPVLDSFSARERKGEKLGPADGIYATMEQLIHLSPPDVIQYMADNLDDNSSLLWVIASTPNCPTNVINRFALIPSTHLWIAGNPATPPQVLESLSHSPSPEVRTRVAVNAKTPKATLEQLTNDPERTVRDAAAKRLKPETTNR